MSACSKRFSAGSRGELEHESLLRTRTQTDRQVQVQVQVVVVVVAVTVVVVVVGVRCGTLRGGEGRDVLKWSHAPEVLRQLLESFRKKRMSMLTISNLGASQRFIRSLRTMPRTCQTRARRLLPEAPQGVRQRAPISPTSRMFMRGERNAATCRRLGIAAAAPVGSSWTALGLRLPRCTGLRPRALPTWVCPFLRSQRLARVARPLRRSLSKITYSLLLQ